MKLQFPCWLTGHKWELYGTARHDRVRHDRLGNETTRWEEVPAIVNQCKCCGKRVGFTVLPDSNESTNVDWLMSLASFGKIRSPNRMSED